MRSENQTVGNPKRRGRVTRRAVLAEAATISSGGELVEAVLRASAAEFAEWAEYAWSEGFRGEALAHEVAVQLAMSAGVDW